MRALLLVALCLALVSAASPASFTSAGNIEYDKAQVTLARHWDTLFTETFEGDLSGWQTSNYEDGLSLSISPDKPHAGAGALRLRWVKNTDTAWEMASQPVAVQEKSQFLFSFWLRNNLGLTGVSGHQGNYQSKLQWQNAAGKVVSETPIPWGDTSATWRQVKVTGETPAGATNVVIRMGFDHPNLGEGEHVALDDLQLSTRGPKSGYEPAGEFVSAPLRTRVKGPGQLKWQAKVPPGTSLAFQVRTAPDDRGGPGKWTDFVPTKGALPALQDWLQYKVLFSTKDPLFTPSLQSVALPGNQAAAGTPGWQGVDVSAPVLVRFSPTRTDNPAEAMRFSLADAGAGLDPRTVALTLDGEAVEAKAMPDGSYGYQPPQPLRPLALQAGFQNWRTRNHANALLIRPEAPRLAGAPESLFITRPAGDTDTAFALSSPQIPVTGGAAYTLSFWLRTDTPSDQADGRYGAGLAWLDADGKPLGEPDAITYGAANPEWHEVRQQATAPAGACWAAIALGWDHPNLANGQFVQFADPQFDGPRPDRVTGPNLHQVRVTAADFAGNALTVDRFILVKEAPKTGLVTIREDGVTLVDGKPFFPIGIYSVSKRTDNNNRFDVALAELKAAGFNLVHTYSSARDADFAELYEAATKHGMKLFIATENGNNSPDTAGAVMTVANECNEPALLAWYLADDTSGHISAEALQRVHQAIMDVDPYHMTIQADGVSGLNDQRYVQYIGSTTGFLPELYPIYKATDNHVADVIRGMKNVQAAWQAAGRVTPVWAIIQDFEGWGWARFPTDEEQRCMVYLALIHGAQGMTWYTYAYRDDKHGAPWDKQKWAYLKSLATELSSLSGVLTSRDPQEQPRGEILTGPALGDLDYPSLNLRLKRHEGNWYLFAANSSDQPLRARITVPQIKGAVEVIGENRKAKASGDRLEDDFAPLAVHIYKW